MKIQLYLIILAISATQWNDQLVHLDSQVSLIVTVISTYN